MKAEEQVEKFKVAFRKVSDEIGKVIVGQKNIVRDTLICLFGGGNLLLEGVPGLGKTLLVRTLSRVLELSHSRIQFTPDLMPADITGTNLVMEKEPGKRVFEFQKGPVFSHLVLADEVNRATPKTQSALLEAMQEHSTTVAGVIHPLPEPFMVLATQNPIEMEGTYPLPEAQLDRFLFKTLVPFPTEEELGIIIDRTTGAETPDIEKILGAEEILEIKQLVRHVLMSTPVRDYISRLVISTHPETDQASDTTKKYVRYGSSPRGAQALVMGSKVNALIDGRYNIGFEDVMAVAKPSLRHRLILNFEAQAEGISPDRIVEQIIQEVPRESPKIGKKTGVTPHRDGK